MAKWGEAKWGTAKWGGAAGPQPVYTGDYIYILNINWAGSFANEANRLVNVQGYRGRQFYVGKSGETFEQVQPGEFTFLVDNWDGRYDPYNSSSPLYGSIEPGKPVEFGVLHAQVQTNYRLFTGHIKDIRPISQRQQAQIIVTDDLQWLSDQDITIPTAYNITVNQAIDKTLDAASYPYARSIATSYAPITFFDPQQANALDTVRQLSDAGLGTIFVDRFGKLTYHDRTTTPTVSAVVDQANLLKEITITQPWDTVRNKITCVANRFGYGPLEELWRLDEPIFIQAGSSKSINIEFEQAKPIQPVRGIDYASIGTLEGFVSGIGWTYTNYLFTASLTNITTTTATVVVQNNDTGGNYLAWLGIRGNKIVNKKITFDAVDAASAAKGPRRLRIDTPWLQDRGFAEAYAPLLLAHLKNPSKEPVVTVDTRTDFLGIDLMDKIKVTSAKLGIDAYYDIGYIDYRWTSPTGQSFEMTVYCQNVLHSTATITPQPYYPTLPPVPPVTPPPPVITPPPTTTQCLSSYPLPEPANGPYSVAGGIMDNSLPVWGIPINYWFRDVYHPNRTYFTIDGLWELNTGGVWAPDASFDFTQITGYNSLGQSVANGVISGSMVADGVRTYVFDNTNPYYVAQLQFRLAASGSSNKTYAAANEIATGTVLGNNPAGEDLTVVPGLAYAIDATGGPWASTGNTPPGPYYNFQINSDGNVGLGWNGVIYAFHAGIPAGVDQVVNLDGTYGRCFFIAAAATVNFRVADSFANIPFLSGTLSYSLKNAAVTIGPDKRVTVRSFNIYNVCAGDPA